MRTLRALLNEEAKESLKDKQHRFWAATLWNYKFSDIYEGEKALKKIQEKAKATFKNEERLKAWMDRNPEKASKIYHIGSFGNISHNYAYDHLYNDEEKLRPYQW